MDLLALVRRRPIVLAVVAGGGLAAWHYLNGGGDASPADPADASAPAAGDGSGGLATGGYGGSGSYDWGYPSVPGSGALQDAGVVTAPPPATTVPAAKTAYQVVVLPPGEYPTLGLKSCNGRRSSYRTGTVRLKETRTYEVRDAGTYPDCDGQGTNHHMLLVSGGHAGRILRWRATETRYR